MLPRITPLAGPAPDATHSVEQKNSARSAPRVSTVLHIEDEPLWREFAAGLLSDWPEVRHVGSAANGRDGIALCREKQPDIVLLDLGLPDIDGFMVLDELNALPRPPRTLLLTGRMNEVLLHRLGTGDIAGLIWKSGDFRNHLRPALAATAAGRDYFPPEVSEAVRRFRGSPDAFSKILTDWEQDLVALLAQGLKDDAIAAKTGCCCGTIRNHWHNMARKLGLLDRHDLRRWAEAKGFGTAPMPGLTK